MNILNRFTNFVLQGRIQACTVAFILAYIPLVGSISVLIAGLVTLRKGAFEGLLVFIAATVPYLLSYYSAPPATDVNVIISLAVLTIVIITASNVLMWLFAILLRRYSSWGFILDITVVMGVISIAILHFVFPDLQNWWVKQLLGYFNKTTEMMKDLQPNANIVPPEAQMQMINAIKQYATGLILASIMFNALLQLLIARWWQAVMFYPGELRKELLNVRLSYIAGIVFLVCFPLTYFGNAIATDVMPILYLVFSMAGLSVMQSLLMGKMRLSWLILLYVAIIVVIMMPGGAAVMAMIFSLIAFLDIGFNFRKKLLM